MDHRSQGKVSNGARRKRQRSNKRTRDAAKQKAQEEIRQTAPQKKKTKHGRRSYPSLLKAIGCRLRKWVTDESISKDRILLIGEDILQRFGKGKVDSKLVIQSVQDLPKDELLERAPEDGVFVLLRESQMPQHVTPSSPSSEDMDISEDDSTHNSPPSSEDMDISDHDSTPSETDNSSLSSDQTEEPAASTPQPWEPRFSAIRLTNVMSEEAERDILNAVQRMSTNGVNAPPGGHRSNFSGAHHVGIWSKFWLTVYATADTLSQNMGAQKEMDCLFELISKHVNEPIMEFLEQADPEYAKTLKRINEYVQTALDDQFIDPPFKHLRKLGPLFNVFAMKYGGSEISHLDLGDAPGLYAIILVLGDFQDGDFCLPHLGYRIPLRRRSVLLVDARRLVHCTGSWAGSRFVITGFIDYNTALHAGIKTTQFFELSDEQFTLWTRGRVFDEHRKVSQKSRKMGRSKPKASTSQEATESPVPPRKSCTEAVGEL